MISRRLPETQHQSCKFHSKDQQLGHHTLDQANTISNPSWRKPLKPCKGTQMESREMGNISLIKLLLLANHVAKRDIKWYYQ